MDRSELEEDEQNEEQEDQASDEPITLEIQDGVVGGSSTNF